MNREPGTISVYKYKLMKVYRASFKSLSDLHKFLSDNPAVNGTVFKSQHSMLGLHYFAGEPYSTALEYCIGGYGADYDIVLKMRRELEKYIPVTAPLRLREKSFADSHPNVPAFIAGSPRAMYRMQRAKEKKFCTVYFNLACPVMASQNVILNRGAITLSLVKLLESSGMGVNLKVFMAAYSRDEIFLFEINLKSPEDLLNAKKCFYPMCSREFTRRLVFRVMESMPFDNPDWYPNYGEPLTEFQVRSVLGLSEKDIVVYSPVDMGLRGEDILEDGENFFKSLELDENILVLKRFAERKN